MHKARELRMLVAAAASMLLPSLLLPGSATAADPLPTSFSDISHTTVYAARDFVVSGHLDGPPSPAEVRVTSNFDSPYGVTGYTDDDGWFAIPVHAVGDLTMHLVVAYWGDPTYDAASAKLDVAGAVYPTTISMSAAETVDVGDTTVLSGTVAGGYPGMEVHLDSSRGNQSYTPAVQPGGTFSQEVAGYPAGPTTWTASFAGDDYSEPASASLVLDVVGEPSVVSVTTDASVYRQGDSAYLDITWPIDPVLPERVVVRGTSMAGTRVIYRGAPPLSGKQTIFLRHVRINETFHASISGDPWWADSTSSAGIEVRARFVTTLLNPIKVRDDYYSFPRRSDPVIQTTAPARIGGCVRFQVERYTGTGTQWQPAGRSGCVALENGTARWTLEGWQKPRTRYRVRPVFDGNEWNTASKGYWARFRFR